MAIEVKLPEMGDGIESVDVLEVFVSEGEVIEKDQGLVELETDKATAEVPSTHAGKILKVHVSVGQSLSVGATLVTIEEVVSESKESVSPSPQLENEAVESPLSTSSKAEAPSTERVAPSLPPVKETEHQTETDKLHPVSEQLSSPAHETTYKQAGNVAAGPAIRRLAREVDVDLGRVDGTGPGGRITRDDVLAVVRQGNQQASSGDVQSDDRETDGFGPVRIERMSKIRKTIASKMHESWESVPRVTNFDDADVTSLEEFRQGSKADYAARGIKLTSMPFLIKAVAMSLKNNPTINASLDLEKEQVIFKDYVNIGIAVDTERGLLVPSLRFADEKSIFDIASDLKTLADNARSNQFSIDDLRGGTFTISNLGAIGGIYSTPIINVPEVAILLVGRSRKMPIVVDDEVQIRLMMPLSLSYDHRLVDGATAARFLNDVIGFLETPSRLLLSS